jgi:lipoprotein-anchoring transpeptidase ErfK/SrfK
MKRILTTAALSAVIASGAFAATEAERVELERFLPNVNVALLDDATVDQLISISATSESFDDRQQQMRALINDQMPVTATFTEAQLVEVRQIAPEVDLGAMTDAQLLQAINYANSADNPNDAAQKIRAIVDDNDEAMLMLTDAEIRDIRLIAPEFDLTMVTEEEAVDLRAALASGDRDRVITVVETIEAM